MVIKKSWICLEYRRAICLDTQQEEGGLEQRCATTPKQKQARMTPIPLSFLLLWKSENVHQQSRRCDSHCAYLPEVPSRIDMSGI